MKNLKEEVDELVSSIKDVTGTEFRLKETGFDVSGETIYGFQTPVGECYVLYVEATAERIEGIFFLKGSRTLYQVFGAENILAVLPTYMAERVV